MVCVFAGQAEWEEVVVEFVERVLEKEMEVVAVVYGILALLNLG